MTIVILYNHCIVRFDRIKLLLLYYHFISVFIIVGFPNSTESDDPRANDQWIQIRYRNLTEMNTDGYMVSRLAFCQTVIFLHVGHVYLTDTQKLVGAVFIEPGRLYKAGYATMAANQQI